MLITTDEAAVAAGMSKGQFVSTAKSLGIIPGTIDTGKRGRKPLGWTKDQVRAVIHGERAVDPVVVEPGRGPDDAPEDTAHVATDTPTNCRHLTVRCECCGKVIVRIIA